MKFKIDENLPVELTVLLQKKGHDAISVLEKGLGGKPDADIALVCQNEKRALVTLDKDFADIRHYLPREFSGIIVFRLNHLDKPHVLEIFEHVIPIFSSEPLEHHLWIVEEDKIRIRD